MFKHLLVPLDGSSLAEAALPAAISLADRYQSEISLFQVTHSPYLSTMAQGDTYTQISSNLRQLARDEALAYLRSHQAKMQQDGLTVHICVEENDQVADVLLDAVRRLDIDTIVMSTHGRSGIRRWIFGSIADKLLRQADVPIVLIRATESEDAGRERS